MTTQDFSSQNSSGRVTYPKTLKLKWRILFFLLLFTVVILALLWLSQVVFFDRIYQEIKIGEFEKRAEELAASLSEEDLAERASAQAEQDGYCLFIYNLSQEKVIVSADCLEDCTLHQIVLQPTRTENGIVFSDTAILRENVAVLCAAAEKAGGSIFYRVTGEESSDFHKQYPSLGKEITLTPGTELEDDLSATSIIYIILAQNADGEQTAIFLNALISPVSATIQTMNTLLKVLSVVLVALAVLLSLLISYLISKPIADLNKSARILATGNYAVVFRGKGYKEVSQLSDSLNYAATELSKVDALQKELIANISHDLRTPLTMITGYAEVMRDIPGENTAENLQIIIDESNRMKGLVSDVLDISRLQSGALQPRFSEFPLTNAVESSLSRYNKLRDREGYIIEFFYDRLITVNADYDMIMQVLFNLVNNAVNYAGEDKKVTVTQTVRENFVRVSVQDRGVGIAPDKLPLIWDRYYKEKTNHRRATVGSGLGLSIVKGIVTAHGGNYGVESELGSGSIFWFEIPYTNETVLQEIAE